MCRCSCWWPARSPQRSRRRWITCRNFLDMLSRVSISTEIFTSTYYVGMYLEKKKKLLTVNNNNRVVAVQGYVIIRAVTIIFSRSPLFDATVHTYARTHARVGIGTEPIKIISRSPTATHNFIFLMFFPFLVAMTATVFKRNRSLPSPLPYHFLIFLRLHRPIDSVTSLWTLGPNVGFSYK